MASAQSITINMEPRINPGTAKLCLAALELFVNQNPEMEIIGTRMPDGTVQLEFQKRKEPDPRFRIKRPENMTPEHRAELGLGV